MSIPTGRSLQEQREECARRRQELVTRALETTDHSELFQIAQQFGELCDEEDALRPTAPPRS